LPKTRFYYGCTVRRVIDGDTIDVDADLGFDVSIKLRLRFAGINTPESRTRNLEEKALGKAATAFLKETLESADAVEFESHDRGKFGRVLATPYIIKCGKRTDIGKLMIREGHARKYDGGKREPWFKD
jgi:endonuclease YncB( thermonuclease family)